MQQLVDSVSELYNKWRGSRPASVDVLPQSGSDRRYFRLHGDDGKTVIGTHGLNVPENEAFIYFANQFQGKGLNVPQVVAVSDDRTVYLQQDFGDVSLMNVLEEKGFTPEVYALFKESLHQLARLQVLGDDGLDYSRCLTNKEFGRQAIKADLFYFKYYFLDALQKPYDKQALGEDFDAISSYLTHTEYKYFMFRDFQSRNILIAEGKGLPPALRQPAEGGYIVPSTAERQANEIGSSVSRPRSEAPVAFSLGLMAPEAPERRDEDRPPSEASANPSLGGGGAAPFFIDFQGGMKGAPQYDVASMLWQARANLPDEWKTNLLEDYLNSFEEVTGSSVDREVFKTQYNGYVLIRLLQVLGAYGFRGLFERKAQFLTSIPQALKNLRWFIEHNGLGISVPEFKRVLGICVDEEIMARFTPVQANEATPLVVKVCSFSYKKGLPEDNTIHGGGFVFDCRGVDNPGRHAEYKEIHGRDKPVMEYLERQTRMNDFLNSVFDLVDISVEEYIKRGFDHLAINFGCTGGQHRSVYAADAVARHLRNKYKVKIELCHREQEAKGWKNPLQPAHTPAPEGEG